MLNIFLIILMLTGIVVFSLQPADKTTTTAPASANEIAAIKTDKPKNIIATVATNSFVSATITNPAKRTEKQLFSRAF
jgi:hypothetical protein